MSGVADLVVAEVDCSVCDSEAGYDCTYMPPQKVHRPTTPGRIALLERVGKAMKRPHQERFLSYRRLLERQAKEAHRDEVNRQRQLKAVEAAKAWRKRNETKIAYQEFGRRESLELGDWLRKNHGIFRINEEFPS